MYTNDDKRVTWVDVPAGASADDVLGKIPMTAVIYRFISNHPILSSNQLYSIDQGQRTMDDFANSQVVRYGDNHSTNAGELILDAEGKPQYLQRFYSSTAKADVDNRNTAPDDFYSSEAITAEMNGTVEAVSAQQLNPGDDSPY